MAGKHEKPEVKDPRYAVAFPPGPSPDAPPAPDSNPDGPKGDPSDD